MESEGSFSSGTIYFIPSKNATTDKINTKNVCSKYRVTIELLRGIILRVNSTSAS